MENKMIDPFEQAPEVPDHGLPEVDNGPTVSYEEALLRQHFGDPVNGTYGALGDGGEE